jgi:structural maintenance of chromosome 2
VKVQESLEVEGKLGEAKGKLGVLEKQEEKGKGGTEKWNEFVKELEIKEHQMRV